MNTKAFLLLSTFCTAFLFASTAALAENFIQINEDGVFVESSGNGVNITRNGVFVRSGNGGVKIKNSSTSSAKPYGSPLQRQQTTISLNSANLRSPHILSISAAPGTQLTGQITINGVVVQTLKGDKAEINLSPRLLRGRQAIEISGNYKPAWSSVQVKLSGPGTTVNQQIGGSGILRQNLMINVR